MKHILFAALSTIFLLSFKTDTTPFVGKILYKYSFEDLKGNNITDKMTPYFGREQHYFIGRESYKAFDESSNWVQLYNSKTNTYYYFNKDKSVQKIDGLTKTSQKVVVTKLDKQESIAGYDCKSVRIDADNTSTIHYYCPSIKTTSSIFAKHNFGNWNTYLEATNGALSLKFVLTDRKNGYIMTAVAKEITKMGLNENDFKLPDDVSLRK